MEERTLVFCLNIAKETRMIQVVKWKYHSIIYRVNVFLLDRTAFLAFLVRGCHSVHKIGLWIMHLNSRLQSTSKACHMLMYFRSNIIMFMGGFYCSFTTRCDPLALLHFAACGTVFSRCYCFDTVAETIAGSTLVLYFSEAKT